VFKKVVSGGAIVTLITIAQFAVLFAVQVIFARLLEPEQFGVFAFIAMITMFFNSLISIYGDKYLIMEKDNTPKILDTIFTMELLWAFFLLCFCILFVPSLMNLLDKSHLTEYIQIFCIIFLYNPLIKPKALFEKELSFFKANMPLLIANIIGGTVGIFLAFGGYGIWSLVWWKISVLIIETVFIWFILPYRPRIYVNYDIVKKSLNFGYPLLVSTVMVFIYSNIDYYIIDQLMDEKTLGFYWMAYQIAHYLLFIRVGINKVLFPIFSKLEDIKSQIKVFDLMTTVTSIIYFIPIFIILLFAEEIILIIYGEKWLASAPLLKVFSVIVLIKGIAGNTSPLLHRNGKTKVDMELAILNLILLPPIIYYFTLFYGTIGASIAIFIIGNISIIFTYQRYIKKLINKDYFDYFPKVFFLLFLCLVLLVINYIIPILFFYKLLLCVGLFIVLYLTYFQDINVISNILKHKEMN